MSDNARSSKKSGLSVGILAWNSENRLRELLDHVYGFADEVVVGVDEASTDGTLEVAKSCADVVFRFQHTGIAAPVRMLLLEHANRDWLLVLDCDERMDEQFGGLIREFLNSEYTHFWFPRKWIVSLRPPRYLRGEPWFPDWQLRLLRNDRSLVWHSPRVHSYYQVMGQAAFEARTSILHFERITTSPDERTAKLIRYRESGSIAATEQIYGPIDQWKPVVLPQTPLNNSRLAPKNPSLTLPETREAMAKNALPPWGATLRVSMPAELESGQRTLADVTATNTGKLAWFPKGLDLWPFLNISYHILDASDRVKLWDGDRTAIGRIVKPDQTGTFLASFTAPKNVGQYLVEWDMVSEGECWFAQNGSSTTRVPVRVTRS
jgi:hypothetical protein